MSRTFGVCTESTPVLRSDNAPPEICTGPYSGGSSEIRARATTMESWHVRADLHTLF